MNKNPYAPPLSNLKMGANHRGNPTKAILIGLLISLLGSVIGAMVVGFAFGAFWVSTGVNPDDIKTLAQSDTSILIAFLIESGIFSIWSGYFVAKKTNYREYKYCLVMVLIATLIGIILMAVMPETYSDQPLWYTIVSFTYYPIVVVFGCWLYVKSKYDG